MNPSVHLSNFAINIITVLLILTHLYHGSAYSVLHDSLPFQSFAFMDVAILDLLQLDGAILYNYGVSVYHFPLKGRQVDRRTYSFRVTSLLKSCKPIIAVPACCRFKFCPKIAILPAAAISGT